MLRLIPVLAAVLLAAGCAGSRSPHSFASCGRSVTHTLDTVYPQTFDCLAAAYRHGCRPVEASVTESGVDSADSYRLRLYRRGSRCAGDVRVDTEVMERHTHTALAACRIAYGYVLDGKRMLKLFQCGAVGDVALGRGRVCTYRYPPKVCRALRIDRRSPNLRCEGVLGTKRYPWGC